MTCARHVRPVLLLSNTVAPLTTVNVVRRKLLGASGFLLWATSYSFIMRMSSADVMLVFLAGREKIEERVRARFAAEEADLQRIAGE